VGCRAVLERWSIRKLRESSGSVSVPVDERSQMIFVGLDWAEAHHDVFVEGEDGKRLGGGRLPGVRGEPDVYLTVSGSPLHLGAKSDLLIELPEAAAQLST